MFLVVYKYSCIDSKPCSRKVGGYGLAEASLAKPISFAKSLFCYVQPYCLFQVSFVLETFHDEGCGEDRVRSPTSKSLRLKSSYLWLFTALLALTSKTHAALWCLRSLFSYKGPLQVAKGRTMHVLAYFMLVEGMGCNAYPRCLARLQHQVIQYGEQDLSEVGSGCARSAPYPRIVLPGPRHRAPAPPPPHPPLEAAKTLYFTRFWHQTPPKP